MMKKIPRNLSRNVLNALNHTPVVFVNGPRQAGKSTMVQMIAKKDFPSEYITFDRVTHMVAASTSPHSFLSEYGQPLILDEVQMVPEIFRALKIVIDELRLDNTQSKNGHYLLTGSANIMILPKLSDSLVGRMSIKTLYPFSACELLDGEGDFVERLFSCDFSIQKKLQTSVNDALQLATFPEISGKQWKERAEWFDGYLMTILQRDVRMISELEKISLLPTLLRTLATRTGGLLNDAEISRDVALNQVTSKNYRCILQAMFLTFNIQPWYRNIGKRLVKSPKGYLTDTLLLCHLLDWKMDDLRKHQPNLYGRVIENFVATELIKILSFSEGREQLLHFRTGDGKEVDFVLERPDGSLVAIEVKTSDTITPSDFKGMKVLQSVAPNDFKCGIVLYSGKHVVPFGNMFFAVPIDRLWR
ncbi:MAG: ATP-binding protein [Gammaproteobacteria bacterium]|nr:ATP-binding protein [Gammaproteobacteria bacterium]MCY4273984.1 ATP-binding protein [Gammaproteobacteria bacterium]